MITFNCPNCSKKYRIHEFRAGNKATCGHCKQVIIIPVPKTEAMPVTSGDSTIYEHFDRLIARLDKHCPQ